MILHSERFWMNLGCGRLANGGGPARLAIATVLLVLALNICPELVAAQMTSERSNPLRTSHSDRVQQRADIAGEAQIIRDTLQRPPADHSTDWVDVVEFPLKVVGWPLDMLLIRLPAWAIANLTAPRPPNFITRGYRAAVGFGFVPKIQTNIGPRSGMAYEQQFTRFRPFYASAAISQRLSQRYRVGVMLDGEPVSFSSEVKWQRDAQMRFYGIGSQTPDDAEAFFKRDWWNASASTSVSASRLFTLSAGLAYEHNTIDLPIGEDESIFGGFPGESLYGALEQTEFAQIELNGTLDLSRKENFQQKGVVVGAAGRFYFGVNETESEFRLLSGFVRSYLPINPQQLFAVRVVSQIARHDAGNAIPFYHLSSLGGSRSALGFPTSRFVDNDMVSIMSEYRYEIWRELHSRMRAETFLFFHYGAVGERLGQIESEDWHPSYGLGLRISQPTMLMCVAYLGFSSEGMTAGVRTSWPF